MIRHGIPMLWLVSVPVCSFFLTLILLAAATPRSNKPVAVRGEEFAPIKSGAIRYQIVGEGGHVVLFLHGFNQHLGIWDAVWARLENCPVRRLRIDVPGFGASRFDTDDYGLAAQTERLVNLLDALKIDKVTVVGTSMGGSLAVSLAAQHPERVERLGLLAPSGYPGSLRYNGLFGRLLTPSALTRAATWLARTSLYKNVFSRSVALQAMTTSASYGPAWLEELRNTRSPAFVAWSKNDGTANSGAARPVVAALREGTLFWLDKDTGHGIPLTRPAFAAEVACLLGQGVAPSDVADKLSASIIHAGEGIDTRAASQAHE